MIWFRRLLETVTVVLVMLKLLGLVNWSWWLVTAPATVPAAVLVLMIVWTQIFHGDQNLM